MYYKSLRLIKNYSSSDTISSVVDTVQRLVCQLGYGEKDEFNRN